MRNMLIFLFVTIIGLISAQRFPPPGGRQTGNFPPPGGNFGGRPVGRPGGSFRQNTNRFAPRTSPFNPRSSFSSFNNRRQLGFGGGLLSDRWDSPYDPLLDIDPIQAFMTSNFNFAACNFNITDGMAFGGMGMQMGMGMATGGEVSGRVTFRQRILRGSTRMRQRAPTTIQINVWGLPPLMMGQMDRGLQILEHGDCLNPGNHFNPLNGRHGLQNSTFRHVGDLGNCVQQGDRMIFSFQDMMISLNPQDQAYIIGKSFVIRWGHDDGGTGQNAQSRHNGNAGDWLACCTIGSSSGMDWTNNRNQAFGMGRQTGPNMGGTGFQGQQFGGGGFQNQQLGGQVGQFNPGAVGGNPAGGQMGQPSPLTGGSLFTK